MNQITIKLKNARADWVDESVVQDGNIITYGKPADLPTFSKVIIDAVIANNHLQKSNEQESKKIFLNKHKSGKREQH